MFLPLRKVNGFVWTIWNWLGGLRLLLTKNNFKGKG